MKASELFEDSCGLENVQISGIFSDSRKIIPGGVFVCLKGEKSDGHNYAKEAEKKGASVIVASEKISAGVPVVYVDDTDETLAKLSEKFFGFPSKRLRLVGVTGTNGKTTVTYLVKSILEAAGKKVGIIGTNKCFVGERELDFSSCMPTTPSALELAQIFKEMADSDCEYVVMEVSSHALALKRVFGLRFEVGVFTNLTRDHLDFHKTMEEYLAAKAKLFDISKKGVVNSDSAAGLKIISMCRCPVISVGIHDADILASAISLGEDFVEFTVSESGEKHNLHLNIPGKFSVYNALCAAGAARALGISYESITAGLASAGNVKGRVELVPTDTPYRVFIDYAHSPDGLSNILHTARGFTRGRVIVLFGCGGDRDRTKRAVMGEIAGNLADFSIITSDNPRTENPIDIIEEIKCGIDRTNGEYIIIVNRREAIEYALKTAGERDTVLLCGKGQETYQIIGDKKLHFDEREVIREILDKI